MITYDTSSMLTLFGLVNQSPGGRSSSTGCLHDVTITIWSLTVATERACYLNVA